MKEASLFRFRKKSRQVSTKRSPWCSSSSNAKPPCGKKTPSPVLVSFSYVFVCPEPGLIKQSCLTLKRACLHIWKDFVKVRPLALQKAQKGRFLLTSGCRTRKRRDAPNESDATVSQVNIASSSLQEPQKTKENRKENTSDHSLVRGCKNIGKEEGTAACRFRSNFTSSCNGFVWGLSC